MKIAYDAGHGRYTPGKRTPDDEREWSFNDAVARAFAAEMAKYEGVDLLRTDDPTGNTDVALSARTRKANTWGADLYVSIHHNANTAKWGSWGGVETYIYTGSQPKSERLAKEVHPRMVAAMGLRDRGIRAANLHIVRETKCPAILTEGGFMDSTTDIGALRDPAKLKAQGVAIAEGVAAYGSLKRKAGAVAAATKPATETPGTYRVITGTFGTAASAKKAAALIGMNSEPTDDLRVATGTFKTLEAAQRAAALIEEKYGYVARIRDEEAK